MKKAIAFVLSVVLLFSAFSLGTTSVCASGAATLSAGVAAGSPGDIVEIAINISDNPGIIAMRFNVGYDATSLKLLSAADAGLLGSNTAIFGNDIEVNPYVLMWEDSLSVSNYTVNGAIATLRFEILDTAPEGDTQITVSLDSGSTFNSNLNNVAFETTNGSVTVESDTTDTPTVSLGSASACTDAMVDIPISIQQNPGIISLSLTVSYDVSKLVLMQVTDGNLLGTDTSIFGNDLTASPYNLLWEDSLSPSDYVADGIIATLKFKIKATAAVGATPITVSVDDGSTFNCNLNTVRFEASNGSVSVDRLNLTASDTSITVGTTLPLSAAYSVNESSPEIVSWTSSNESIASVNSYGAVTGKQHGNVKITAVDSDGNTAEYFVQVLPLNATVLIGNYSGEYTQKVNWWKKYSSATMSLYYTTYNCNEAVRYVWTSNSTKVRIDQNGNITNIGSFSRSATITLTAYDAENNIIAKSTVTVSFYKFSWQRSRLQSQSIVSDNILQQNLSENELELYEAKQQNPTLTFITDFVYYLLDLFKVIILH